MTAELTEIRNSLYNSIPTGQIDAFELIRLIYTHLEKLDTFIDKTAKSEAGQNNPVCPVWVKASDRLPDHWAKKIARFIYTKLPIIDPKVLLSFDPNTINHIEWLDESAMVNTTTATITSEIPLPDKNKEALKEVVNLASKELEVFPVNPEKFMGRRSIH